MEYKLISIIMAICVAFCISSCSNSKKTKAQDTSTETYFSSKNEDGASDADISSDSPKTYYSSTFPEWNGKVFEYYNTTCDSLDLFVDWIKADGKLEIDGVRYDQWEYGDAFLETASKEKEILLPIAKNGSEFFNARVRPNMSRYSVIYDNKLDSGETVSLDITLMLGSENEEYGSAFEFAQDRQGTEGVRLYKSNHRDYGWYCYSNYTKDASGNRNNITSAYIEVNGAYVVIDVWGDVHEKPWNPKYFDYFDFEKVTLK